MYEPSKLDEVKRFRFQRRSLTFKNLIWQARIMSGETNADAAPRWTHRMLGLIDEAKRRGIAVQWPRSVLAEDHDGTITIVDLRQLSTELAAQTIYSDWLPGLCEIWEHIYTEGGNVIPQPKRTIAATAAARDVCYQRLMKLMAGNSAQAKKKSEYRDEMVSEIKNLSQTQFNEMWKQAKKDSGNLNWGKSGPKAPRSS